MKEKYLGLNDESGDRKYFTIIPNFITNHSTAIEQALYLQMKRLVGESDKLCLASEKYLCDKLKIGKKALQKSIKYLIDHDWISYAGYRLVDTPGGKQKVKSYSIHDIWKMNTDYYNQRGIQKKTPLNQGVFQSIQRGVQKDTKGCPEEQQSKNYSKNINKSNKSSFINRDKGIQISVRKIT